MNMEDLAAYESMRTQAYRLFAECYRLPETELDKTVGRLRRELEGMGSASCTPAEKMYQACGADRLETLKVDYARLFVGPYGLPAAPYGSVYLEEGRKIMGDSTIDARRMYMEAGVDIAAACKDAPDHIAVELEFLHLLSFREVEAMRRGDMNDAALMIGEQAAFLARHLGLWVEPFARSVEKAAETAFYRSLGEATRIFVLEDQDRIARGPSGLFR